MHPHRPTIKGVKVMAGKIHPKGTKATEICAVCGKVFEYVSDGESVPTCCSDCPSLYEAMCDLVEAEIDQFLKDINYPH